MQKALFYSSLVFPLFCSYSYSSQSTRDKKSFERFTQRVVNKGQHYCVEVDVESELSKKNSRLHARC